MVKKLPDNFLKTLTDKIIDRGLNIEKGKEEHVCIDDKFGVKFVPVEGQINQGWQRIGTIGFLDMENIPAIRRADSDPRAYPLYEIDDGLGNDVERQKLEPNRRPRRTMLDSSFVQKPEVIDYLKEIALKEQWYIKMSEIAQQIIDLKAEP